MRKKGVDLQFDARVSRIDKTNGALRVALADGLTVEADTVMYATGRLPKVRGLGLEEIGVQFNDKGAIVVDNYSRSSVPHIFAVGDCTDRINLTPVAIKEGQAVAETLYGGRPVRPDHTIVPSAVFSQPPIGSVGLTEAEAGEARPIDVYISRFKPMKHTLTGGEERTMMKIIVDRETDRVLGCHMVGMDAAEIIQGIAIALKCGATKAQFDATVGIHPTAAEEFVTMREPV
jgi:glutathione reductase (NADPH)